MPDLVEDIEIYPRMVALAGALEARLAARGVPAAATAIVPEGLPAIDYFGDGCEGYAWVRLTGAFPYQTFPEQDSTGATCVSLIGYVLEVGYAHCAPMMDDDGTPPSVAQQIEATRVQTSAMRAMHEAIRQALGGDEGEIPYVLGTYQPDIALGGALGATWSVTVGDRRG